MNNQPQKKRILQEVDSNPYPGPSTQRRRMERLTPPASPDIFEDGDDSQLITLHREYNPSGDFSHITVTKREIRQFLEPLRTLTESDFIDVPEKSPSFFLHHSALHLGSILAVRRFTDTSDNIDKVYVMKENQTGSKPSIIKLKVDELEDFLYSMIHLHKKIQKGSQYLYSENTTHNFQNEQFFRDPITIKSPGGEILIRPFMFPNDTRQYVRVCHMLRKPEVDGSGQFTSWCGPAFTITLGVYLGLITILGTLLEQVWEEQEQ